MTSPSPAPRLRAGGSRSIWIPRLLAGSACLVLAVLVGWQFGMLPEGLFGSVEPVDPSLPDQRVTVEARRTARFEILVDGEVVLDRVLPGGETVEAEGHRRVEVRLDGAETAYVTYNGELVQPQGRQDVPRRLVFIDDVDGGP